MMLPKHSTNTTKSASSVAQLTAPVQQMVSITGAASTAPTLSSAVAFGNLAVSMLISNSASVAAANAAKAWSNHQNIEDGSEEYLQKLLFRVRHPL